MENPNSKGENNGSDSRPFGQKFNLRRFLFYVITLAALILIYLKFSEIKLIRELFLRSNLFWLIGIIVIQFLNYYFTALNFKDVLRVKYMEVSLKELFPVTFVIQFLNQALPSAGFSGQVFFVHYLKKYNLTIIEGIGRAILELTTLYMAFGTFFLISIAMMYEEGVMDRHPEAKIFFYVFLGFAVLALFIFFMIQKKKQSRLTEWFVGKIDRYFEGNKKKKDLGEEFGNHSSHVAAILEQFNKTLNIRELKKRGRPFWRAYLWQNLMMFSNVITLYLIGLALDINISFIAAFITFSLMKFISMVSVIPGALGIFEGGMTLVLISFGVNYASAFAVTMLFRAFTFWLPMPVGWIIYRWYLHRQELENPYETEPI